MNGEPDDYISSDGVMTAQLYETTKKNFDKLYDNAIQCNAWTCIDCVKPFLTTFRAFEEVSNCPYCLSDNIKQTANMKGVKMIVVW